jgi:23S rRNA maturation-related 3'-5' exoribonuclease YhaM
MKTNSNNNREYMNRVYNPDFVAHVKMYADNVREIWDQQDATACALARKMVKGIQPDRDQLAESATVKRIAAAAKRAAACDTWCKPTAQDMAEVRRQIAAYIIDELAAWKAAHPEELSK